VWEVRLRRDRYAELAGRRERLVIDRLDGEEDVAVVALKGVGSVIAEDGIDLIVLGDDGVVSVAGMDGVGAAEKLPLAIGRLSNEKPMAGGDVVVSGASVDVAVAEGDDQIMAGAAEQACRGCADVIATAVACQTSEGGSVSSHPVAASISGDRRLSAETAEMIIAVAAGDADGNLQAADDFIVAAQAQHRGFGNIGLIDHSPKTIELADDEGAAVARGEVESVTVFCSGDG